MSNRYAEIIVLAEDALSANFMRRYAQRTLDLNTRGMREEVAPPGKGDAKQWVIRQYAIEVTHLQRAHKRAGLIVHVDADVDSVENRFNQLAEAIRSAGKPARDQHERIALAIPRRHIETWLCILTGIDVDEQRDCKRDRILRDPYSVVKTATEALYQATRSNADPVELPSLAHGINELQRLEI